MKNYELIEREMLVWDCFESDARPKFVLAKRLEMNSPYITLDTDSRLVIYKHAKEIPNPAEEWLKKYKGKKMWLPCMQKEGQYFVPEYLDGRKIHGVSCYVTKNGVVSYDDFFFWEDPRWTEYKEPTKLDTIITELKAIIKTLEENN